MYARYQISFAKQGLTAHTADETGQRRFNLSQHGSVEAIVQVADGFSSLYPASNLEVGNEQARPLGDHRKSLVQLEVVGVGFLLGERWAFNDFRSFKEGYQRIEELLTVIELQAACLASLDNEVLTPVRAPRMADGAGEDRVHGTLYDDGQAEQKGRAPFVVIGFVKPELRQFLERRIGAVYVDSIIGVAGRFQDGPGNALGSLAGIVTGKHTVDVGLVEGPASGAQVQTEHVDGRDQDYPLPQRIPGPAPLGDIGKKVGQSCQYKHPIQLITMGYYLEQTGYLALVFDTRPDADSDGQWTLHIDDDINLLHFPKWCSLVESWYDHKPTALVLPDGTSCRVTRESHTQASIARVFGEMLRDTMLQLRDENALRPLPLGKGAFLIVEEFDGHWNWPRTNKSRKQVKLDPGVSGDYSELDEQSDEDRKEALLKQVRKLPIDEQISFWISELNRHAFGKRSKLAQVFLDRPYPGNGNEFALDELGRLGQRSVIPLLELVRKLARYPEWDGDRPKRKFGETPMRNVAVGAIRKVRDLGYATEQVESLLHQIVRRACKTNADRRVWGFLPFQTAKTLEALFDGYSKPELNGKTNGLKSPEHFQSRPK